MKTINKIIKKFIGDSDSLVVSSMKEIRKRFSYIDKRKEPRLKILKIKNVIEFIANIILLIGAFAALIIAITQIIFEKEK